MVGGPRDSQRRLHTEVATVIKRRKVESGFSFMDVMIAMTILLVGLLSLTAALSAALVRVRESESQYRAKMLALTCVESVYAARDVPVTALAGTSGGSTFFQEQIKNEVNGGIFLDGRTPVYELPGPDGIYGTDDDDGDVIPGIEREIVITDFTDDTPVSLRQVTVTIYYQVGRALRDETATVYVGDVQRQSNV
jgi:hypothetical protein